MTEFGAITENQVTLSFLPFRADEGPWGGRSVDILPVSITVDMSTKKVTEADVTLF